MTQYLDPERFRDVMGHYPTGVTIVTCRASDGRPVGVTANSVTSVSLHPPLVLVCLSRASSSLEPILESGAFAINILDVDGAEVASKFAAADRDARFEGVGFRTEETGSPLLDGALAWLECSIFETFDAGDHVIIVGSVQDGGAQAGMPLLYFKGRYGRLRP